MQRLRLRLRCRPWLTRRRVISVSWCGNINPLPFRQRAEPWKLHPRLLTALADGLGSTDPHSTAVHVEPFSTSVHKVLTWVFATTTKICTNGSSGKAHASPSTLTITTLLLVITWSHFRSSQPQRCEYKSLALAPSIFRASWFGRWVVTHSLAGTDFHGHRPAVNIN